VAGSKGSVDASRIFGCGVRAHAARGLRGRRGRHRDTGRPIGHELVEAGERLVLAIDVEVLEARDAAVVPEGIEVDEVALEGAAAGAVDPGERPPGKERLR